MLVDFRIFSIIFALIFVRVISKTGAECIFQGSCGFDYDSEKPLPCAVSPSDINRLPQEYLKNDDWHQFESFCSEMAVQLPTNRKVCCHPNQVQTLIQESKIVERLGMTKCPGCHKNFKSLMCQMTCSPNQDLFLAVNRTEKLNDKEVVRELVYALDETFAQETYDLCASIRSNLLIRLMTLMCGSHGTECNMEKWFDFLGSTYSEGGYSPFKIHYAITTNSRVHLVPSNHSIVPLHLPFHSKC